VLAAIDVAEARKAAIHAAWCAPGYYETTSKEAHAASEAELAALGKKIDALVAEWESIEGELAE
jgi:hypothetical protein